MKTLKDFHQAYETIMDRGGDTQELSNLMTEMENEFKIPALQNQDWEQQNRKVIALYRKISMSREF